MLDSWGGSAAYLQQHVRICQAPPGLLKVSDASMQDTLRLLMEQTDSGAFSLVGHGPSPEKNVALIEGDALAAALAAAKTGSTSGAALLRFASRFFELVHELSGGRITPARANKAEMWLLAHGLLPGSKMPPHPHGPASVIAAPDGIGRVSAQRELQRDERELLTVLRISPEAGSPLLLQPPAGKPWAVCPEGSILAYGLDAEAQGRNIPAEAVAALLAGQVTAGDCRTRHGVTPRGTCLPAGYVFLSLLQWMLVTGVQSDAEATDLWAATLNLVMQRLAKENGLPQSAAEAGLPAALPLLDASASGFLERYKGSPAMISFCEQHKPILPSSLAFSKMTDFKPLMQQFAKQLTDRGLHQSALAHPAILRWLMRQAVVTAQAGEPAFHYRRQLAAAAPSRLQHMADRVKHEGPAAVQRLLQDYRDVAALLTPEQHAAISQQLLPYCHNIPAVWWLLRHSTAEAEVILSGLRPEQRRRILALMDSSSKARQEADEMMRRSMQISPPTAAYEQQLRAAYCLAQ